MNIQEYEETLQQQQKVHVRVWICMAIEHNKTWGNCSRRVKVIIFFSSWNTQEYDNKVAELEDLHDQRKVSCRQLELSCQWAGMHNKTLWCFESEDVYTRT